ncbi:MAG: hypothetical protein BWY31_03627 [Lentisphaerae bacterium ADurb.Bin242]|nr:MAG: hypothetical protein BWY31_03627 [Lentisphaerae bacterium ADurb.Bin242]
MNRERPRRNDGQRHNQRNPRQREQTLPLLPPEQEGDNRRRGQHESEQPLGEKRQPDADPGDGQISGLFPQVLLGICVIKRGHGEHDEETQMGVEHPVGADRENQPGQQKHRRRDATGLLRTRAAAEQPDERRRQQRAERPHEADRAGNLAEDRHGGGVHPVPQHRLFEVGQPVEARDDEVAGGDHLAGNLRIARFIRHEERPLPDGPEIEHGETRDHQKRNILFHNKKPP